MLIWDNFLQIFAPNFVEFCQFEIHESIENSNSVLDINGVKLCPNELKFKPRTIEQLFDVVKNLKNKKDFDGVNVQFVLDSWSHIGETLLDIVNQSLREGIFSECWKHSMVVAVEKVAGASRPEDFRPINMMSTFEKIIEAVVKEQLLQHIQPNDILISEQSGYRQFHSCETALNYVIADWKCEIDNRNIVLAVFVDFKRAFETIDRDVLLKKLERYGVKGVELKWFSDYLSDRHQTTKFGRCKSSPLRNELGLPQGSILSAILFSLYINDIKSVFRNCNINLFADDTAIYVVGKDIDELVEKMNGELNNFDEWLKVNKLKLNAVKTKYMVLGHKNIENVKRLSVGNAVIDRVSEIKYLGCIIDEKLNFNANCNYVCKKMAKKTNFFGRISIKLNKSTRLLVYNTIIAPHINYCSTILFLSDKSHIDRIQKLQNKCMRIILRKRRRTHIKTMLAELNFISVQQQTMRDVLIFIHKIQKGLLPQYLTSCFQSNEGRSYILRNHGDLRLPLFRKSSTQRSLMFDGAKMYNKIPMEVRQSDNMKYFKNYSDQYVKMNYD